MKRVFLAFSLSICLLLAGCAQAVQESLDDPDSDALLEQVIGAVERGDIGGIIPLFYPGILSDEEIAQGFAEIQTEYGARMQSWELISRDNNRNTVNGRATLQVTNTYRLLTDGGDYYVFLHRVEDPEGQGLVSFRLQSESDYNLSLQAQTPAISNSRGFSIASGLITLFGVACQIFILISIISALRTKLRMKPLMILLCLAQIGPRLSMVDNNISFTFNFRIISILELPHLTAYPGGLDISLLFPAGALLYWMIRRHMLRPPEIPAEAVPPTGQAGYPENWYTPSQATEPPAPSVCEPPAYTEFPPDSAKHLRQHPSTGDERE